MAENNEKQTRNKRGTHPNSLANLKPFVEGNSGGGRTEGSFNLSTILREMIVELAPGDIVNAKFVKEFCKGKKTITNAHALAARLWNEGLVKGEAWAIKEIFDRTEGKAMQALELTGKDGGAIETTATLILDFNGNDNDEPSD